MAISNWVFVWYFKAYMNSDHDIPLETAAIFFLAHLYLKQGIGLVFVMVDFICMGLPDLWGAQTENYKIKNACQKWDLNPGPSASEAN